MSSPGLHTLDQLFEPLEWRDVGSWAAISTVLDSLRDNHIPSPVTREHLSRCAFVSFDFRSDSLSQEIYKYASCLEDLFHEQGYEPQMHFIAGEFSPSAEVYIKSDWTRYECSGLNGWAKWDGGKWFTRLFYEEMAAGSTLSAELAVEIWTQALDLSRRLADYMATHDIGLIIIANLNSNPGNLAASLAMVIASELLHLPVLNTNHDFYWEGGKAAWQKKEDEGAGIRDHFFRNEQNHDFFDVFTRLLPWAGQRWIQLNAHHTQSVTLQEFFRFDESRVHDIGTAVPESLFTIQTEQAKAEARQRMAAILKVEGDVPRTVSLTDFRQRAGEWLLNQQAVCCGIQEGMVCPYQDPSTIVFLQPTRVTSQKCIDRNCDLMAALLRSDTFLESFEQSDKSAMILHVSGVVPLESMEAFTMLLDRFHAFLEKHPSHAANIFLVFSVNVDSTPCFDHLGYKPVMVHDLYMMADLVVLPSEVEGRGLPLIESAASGVPILCRRFEKSPGVFSEIVGERRAASERLQFAEFPTRAFSESRIREIRDLLFNNEVRRARSGHNWKVARERFTMKALQSSFSQYLAQLVTL